MGYHHAKREKKRQDTTNDEPLNGISKEITRGGSRHPQQEKTQISGKQKQ
jgi:hypothetical protein